MRYLVLLGAISTGLLGCGPNAATFPTTKEWSATQWSGGLVPNLVVTITSDTIHGRAPCNRFSGKFIATESSEITIGPLAVTRMTCPDISVETEILNDLSRMTNWSLRQTDLHLNGPNGQTLIFAPR